MSKRLKYNPGADDLKTGAEWLKRCFTCKHQYCTRDNTDELKCSLKKCKYEKEKKNDE